MAVRGREGGVHKGAPSNTQKHWGELLPQRARRWVRGGGGGGWGGGGGGGWGGGRFGGGGKGGGG